MRRWNRLLLTAAQSVTAPGSPAPRETAPGDRGDFHIPSLDGIRAISFLIVFFAHAGWYDVVPGGFGVTVFFFLSGYLITTLLRMEHERTRRISLRGFYLRRALRILPPFYTVLALAVLLTLAGVLVEPLRANALFAQVAHFTNYWSIYRGSDGQPEGTAVYWSLAVEEHFYLLFPCLFILLQRVLPGRFRVQALVLLGLCAAVLAWRCALVFLLNAPMDRTYLASDTRVDSILFGCALALGANPVLDKRRIPAPVTRYVLLPAGLALLLATFIFRAPAFRETFRYSLQGIGLVPLFVVAMREPALLPFRFLNLAPVRRLGVLSYSLYLLHFVILHAVPLAPLGVIAHAAVALGLAIAAAEIIHRWIEKPSARLRRRFAHPEAAQAAPAALGLQQPG